jgi:AAA15 family ATPase/GTPase
MLLQFNFKNFKSFKYDTTLDLTATKITEYNHAWKIGNEKILPVTVVFGANASGKSNIIEAFEYMSKFVYSSLHYGDGEKKKRKDGTFFEPPTPFLFDEESKDAESSFEVYFIDSKKRNAKFYNYGFCIDKEGVTEEWLNSKAKTSRDDYKRVFYRNRANEELDLSGIPTEWQKSIKVALGGETLIVSLGAKLQVSELLGVFNWFDNNEIIDFGNPLRVLLSSSQLPKKFADDENVQKNVLDYLSSFDSSIINFNVEKNAKEGDDDLESYKVEAVHRMTASNKTAAIPLSHESAGTLKMFTLYQILQNVLNDGSVLIIDELNAKLHPLLVRTFIQSFTNPDLNKHKAQLIFTTHDAWQLNSGIFRRDEIWFTEKSSDGISTIYSLADFIDEEGAKIRKDENYEKNYLLGKYGAIPSMKQINLLAED